MLLTSNGKHRCSSIWSFIVCIFTSVYLVWISWSMCYITLMYTMDMLSVWPLLTVMIDLIGHSIPVHVQYIHCVLFQTIILLLSLQHRLEVKLSKSTLFKIITSPKVEIILNLSLQGTTSSQRENCKMVSSFKSTKPSQCVNYPKSALSKHTTLPKWKLSKSVLPRPPHASNWKLRKISPFRATIPSQSRKIVKKISSF